MHLSHKDTATWIEKTNRYTSRPGRAGVAKAADVTRDGIMALMQAFMAKVPPDDHDGYLAAVAALRGVYDVVDAVKRWEAEQPQSGQARFAKICKQLNSEYDALPPGLN
jgi:hypothetical protein